VVQLFSDCTLHSFISINRITTSTCQNTGGGYTCKCKSGYQQKNAYECEGKKMTIESSNMGSNEKNLKNRDIGNKVTLEDRDKHYRSLHSFISINRITCTMKHA
jgi:hypothetical protein